PARRAAAGSIWPLREQPPPGAGSSAPWARADGSLAPLRLERSQIPQVPAGRLPAVADPVGGVDVVVRQQALLPLQQRRQEPTGGAVVARSSQHDDRIWQRVGRA